MVMNSFTSESIQFNRRIYNEQKNDHALNGISWTSADANLIHSNEEIQTVILGFMTDKEKLLEELKHLGWSITFVSEDETYKSKVHILRRQWNQY